MNKLFKIIIKIFFEFELNFENLNIFLKNNKFLNKKVKITSKTIGNKNIINFMDETNYH